MVKKLSLFIIIGLITLITISIYYYSVNLRGIDIFNLDRGNTSSNSTTAPKLPDTLVFWGDSGTGDNNQMEVRDAISNYCTQNKCSEAFILGDLVYWDKKSDKQIELENKLTDVYNSLNIPINLVLGNHDYEFCLECILAVESPYSIPDKYYVKEYENIIVYTINTEEMTDEQVSWLEDQLKTESTKWKIVASHRPLITNDSAHHNEKWKNIDKVKDLVCNNVDLFISGHSHTMEYFDIDNCDVKQVIQGAGGIALRDPAKNTKPEYYFKQFGFGSITITKDEILLKYLDTDLNSIFEKTFTK